MVECVAHDVHCRYTAVVEGMSKTFGVLERPDIEDVYKYDDEDLYSYNSSDFDDSDDDDDDDDDEDDVDGEVAEQ